MGQLSGDRRCLQFRASMLWEKSRGFSSSEQGSAAQLGPRETWIMTSSSYLHVSFRASLEQKCVETGCVLVLAALSVKHIHRVVGNPLSPCRSHKSASLYASGESKLWVKLCSWWGPADRRPAAQTSQCVSTCKKLRYVKTAGDESSSREIFGSVRVLISLA